LLLKQENDKAAAEAALKLIQEQERLAKEKEKEQQLAAEALKKAQEDIAAVKA
jgi:hypothetical protein